VDPEPAPPGLLDGLDGRARQERQQLLRWLLDHGFDVDQVRNTPSPILLPANRVYGDDGTLVSARTVADSSGAPLDLISRLHRAVGLARVDPDKAIYARADAESILPAKALVDFGIDPEQVILVVRLLMEGLTRAAVAMRQGGLQTLLRPGATEVELAEAFEALARGTEPLIDSLIRELARLALRHSFENEAVGAAERASGTLPGGRPITVAFADLVGFTQLGEALPPEELSEVATRLANLTRDVVTEPVHFVKTIGDAVMLVSPDAQMLLTAIIEVMEGAAAEGLPRLRAGVASASRLVALSIPATRTAIQHRRPSMLNERRRSDADVIPEPGEEGRGVTPSTHDEHVASVTGPRRAGDYAGVHRPRQASQLMFVNPNDVRVEPPLGFRSERMRHPKPVRPTLTVPASH
jgi:adenylate cyclase